MVSKYHAISCWVSLIILGDWLFCFHLQNLCDFCFACLLGSNATSLTCWLLLGCLSRLLWLALGNLPWFELLLLLPSVLHLPLLRLLWAATWAASTRASAKHRAATTGSAGAHWAATWAASTRASAEHWAATTAVAAAAPWAASTRASAEHWAAATAVAAAAPWAATWAASARASAEDWAAATAGLAVALLTAQAAAAQVVAILEAAVLLHCLLIAVLGLS